MTDRFRRQQVLQRPLNYGSEKLHEAGEEFIVLFRAHEAEPEIRVVKEGEGRAVPYHHFPSDCMFKEVVSRDALFFDPHKDEVGSGGVYLYIAALCQDTAASRPLG